MQDPRNEYQRLASSNHGNESSLPQLYEGKLAEAFERVSDAFYAVDREWRFTYVNRRAQELLGCSQEELLGKNIWEEFPQAVGSESYQKINQAMEEGVTTEFETVSPVLGTWIAGRVYPSPDGLSVYFQDVTKRKRTEEALNESNRRTENILESITDEFFAVDREWRFTYINERALRRIQGDRGKGLTREDLLGKNIWEVYPELVGSVYYHKYHDAVREQKTSQFEGRSSLSEGWYEVHAYPSEEGLSVYYRDITERKRAEESLRESEERYRKLFDSIDEGFAIVEMLYDEQDRAVDYRILETNPAFGRMTGFADAAGKTSLELNLDAELYWFETLGRVATVFANTTERKRAEEELRKSQEALRKSEEFHRFAVEAGRIGTWDLDLQTEECLISPTMADLMGFSPDQTTVPGAQWQESIVPDDRSLLASALATSIESDAPFDLEFRIALKDGTERWLYSRAGVTRDASGKALRVYGVSIDVTERKRAEEKLLKSEERLQRAIGIETVGVISFKVDGSITDSNDAFLRMSGYSREDLEQGKVWWDVMTPPEWMPHSLKAIEEFESTGRTKPYEKEYVRKDGSRWWGLFAATRLDEEEGVEFIIDITERKRAQEEHERLLARGWKARAEAEERKRISRELHDRVAHAMGVVHQSLELHEVLKHTDPETARAKIALAKETTKEAMSLTRNLSQELRGKEVQAGLSAALSDLLETAVPPGLDCAVCVEGEEALITPHVREEMFVILREGVRNAA